jgi:hypothetical protein
VGTPYADNCPSAAQVHVEAASEGHAPVVAVLRAAGKKSKADVSIAAPKGHGPRTLRPFPLQTDSFQGTAGRGHDRHRGPLGKPTS